MLISATTIESRPRACRWSRWLQGLSLLGCACLPAGSQAGAYVFAGEANGEDLVTHPETYTGTGGTVTVRVCIDPGSPDAAAMEIPVQNNINIYNRLEPTTGNVLRGGANNIPSGQFDFESTSLHEIGHCLGLAHPNLGSGQSVNSNYTISTNGVDNVYNASPGADNIVGSSDDVRGDDGNLHWFRKANNNPFTIDDPVDSTTYSVDLADLPGGHSFAANGDRSVAAALGYPNTEAVMQQGISYDEAQRTLGHDDVATLLYAASGKNERAGTGGDDYTIRLEYGGISSSNCNISLAITNTTSVAFCSFSGQLLSGAQRHARVTNTSIEFGSGYSWFFNTETVNQAPVLDPVGNQTVAEGQTAAAAISANDADGDNLAISASGLPAFASLTDHGGGSATLDITPAPGDAGTYPVTISVTDDGLPVLNDSENIDIIIGSPSVDSDGDGIDDTQEGVLGTDPNDVDSDDDGLVDGAGGIVPLAALPGGVDSDADGFVDGEQDNGTDPTLPDSDGDRIDDGVEVANNSDPSDPASWPSLGDCDIAPLGDPDGALNAADLYIAQQIVLQLIPATPLELAHCDIYPPGAPDDAIDLSDLILMQQMLLFGP